MMKRFTYLFISVSLILAHVAHAGIYERLQGAYPGLKRHAEKIESRQTSLNYVPACGVLLLSLPLLQSVMSTMTGVTPPEELVRAMAAFTADSGLVMFGAFLPFALLQEGLRRTHPHYREWQRFEFEVRPIYEALKALKENRPRAESYIGELYYLSYKLDKLGGFTQWRKTSDWADLLLEWDATFPEDEPLPKRPLSRFLDWVSYERGAN